MLTSLNPIKYTIKLLYFALTWRTWFYRVSTVGCLEIVNRQTLTSVINTPVMRRSNVHQSFLLLYKYTNTHIT